MARHTESTAGAIAGFQAPIGIRRRKKNVDEFIELTGIPIQEVVAFLRTASPATIQIAESLLDERDFVGLMDVVESGGRYGAIRAYVRSMIHEFVKKDAESDKYVLYKPRGKGEKPKQIGKFPTRYLAKQAELQRFPPRDPEKRKKRKKEVDRMRKKRKREAVELAIKEGLAAGLVTEATASRWEALVARLPDHVAHGDKRLQAIAKDISKRREKLLQTVTKELSRSLSSAGFEVQKAKGSDGRDGRAVVVAVDKESGQRVPVVVDVGPDGRAVVQMAEEGRTALAQMDPAMAKSLRGEVATANEQAGDDETVSGAMGKRDVYLDSIEEDVDDLLSGLSALEMAVLKRLIQDKYRKITEGKDE